MVYSDSLQDLIEKGKLKFLELDKANQLVDTDPFPMNMLNVNFPRGHRKSWPNMNISDPWARKKYAFHDQRREPVYDSEDEDAYKMTIPPNLVVDFFGSHSPKGQRTPQSIFLRLKE